MVPALRSLSTTYTGTTRPRISAARASWGLAAVQWGHQVADTNRTAALPLSACFDST